MRELRADGTDPVEEWKLEQKKEIVGRIANKYLEIETLKAQNSDDADFHDVNVVSLEAALIAAFEAGQKEFML